MSRAKLSEDVQIASLKAKAAVVFDPMAPGTGTPWEDRGSAGSVGGFFRTAFGSLFGVGPMVQKIRRPETTGDAKLFVIGMSICWGLCGLIHTWLYIHKERVAHELWDFDSTWAMVYYVINSAGLAAAVYFLFNVFNAIYGRLIAQEKGAPLFPPPLIYNVNSYALGPSILSVVPYVGPPVAVLWILVDMTVAGKSRLRLRTGAAAIDAVLPMIAVVGALGVATGIGWLIMHNLLDHNAVTEPVKGEVPKY